MSEKYSNDTAPGSTAETTQARELLARLLPDADAALLVAALLAESPLPADIGGVAIPDETGIEPPERELQRVRRQFALGEAARSAQHDLNNPLTALLAEVQLLELEALAPEQRAATRRIVELARRVAAVARRLTVTPGPTIG